MALLVLMAALLVLTLHSPADTLAALTARSSGAADGSGARGEGPEVDERIGPWPGTGPAPAPAPSPPPATERADGSGMAPPAATGTRPSTSLLLDELRGGWRVESGAEEAGALALLAGHAWAAALAGPGSTSRPLVAVEAVERPGPFAAVVTLLVAPTGMSGVALDAAPETSRLVRLAVPVLTRADGAVLAGPPWILPPPSRADGTLAGAPVADTELLAAARRALASIGLDADRLTALEATEGWPFIARLDAPSGSTAVWLRWHVDRFVVAGLPLHSAGAGAVAGADKGAGARAG